MANSLNNGFSVPELNKPVLLSLGMITESNALDFYKEFQPISKDSLVAELEASGKIKQTGQEKFKMLRDSSKDRNKFTVTANVVVTASAPVTVTIANYTDTAETLSAPADGLFFVENSTGYEFEVTAVNKGTAGAHTATIKPTKTGVTVTIPVADAEFISIGRPSVQESSFQQDGEYGGWGSIENETTIIRTNKQYSDLATMIQLETRGGQTYYNLDRTEITKQHIDVKEIQLIDGDIRNSVTSTGNVARNSRGLVPLVKQYGTTMDGTGGVGETLSDQLFLDISRAIDGDGRSTNYAGLIGSEAYYLLEDYVKANSLGDVVINVNNGDTDDIQSLFDYSIKQVKIKGITYNFKKYNYWNSARLAGADVTKSPKALGMLLIPQGGVMTSEGWKDNLRLRYLNNDLSTDEGLLNHLDYDGALFNRNTTRNGLISVTSYMGIEANDIDSFMFIQLAGQ